MVTISLCMIVKNEEETLDRCLNSVKDLVDEIIIVDTGSTDKTKAIANKFTSKVYDFVWCYDFAKARNYAFSKATKDYIMWLDADDVILKNDQEKLYRLREKIDNTVDCIMLKYNLGLDVDGNPALSFYRERIVKRNNKFKWVGRIHEVIDISGNIMYEDIAITHKKINESEPGRNLIIFQKMVKEGQKFNARQTFYYARELYYNKFYNDAIYHFNKFLEMEDAWVENKISACIDLYNLYIDIGNRDLAIKSVLNSLKYDTPRAEICCIIGSFFMEDRKYKKAIYWYKEAMTKNIDIESGGFYIKDAYDYIPALNLAVCSYNIGNIELAKKYNEMAGKIKPNSKQYLMNKDFFENLKNQFFHNNI